MGSVTRRSHADHVIPVTLLHLLHSPLGAIRPGESARFRTVITYSGLVAPEFFLIQRPDPSAGTASRPQPGLRVVNHSAAAPPGANPWAPDNRRRAVSGRATVDIAGVTMAS